MDKKIIIVFTIFIFLLLPIAQASQPIGIVGYVKSTSGSPIEGATVTILNNITGLSDTNITDENGLFITSLDADDGDLLIGTASYRSRTGENDTFANLSILANWKNFTVSGGKVEADFDWSPENPDANQTITFSEIECSADITDRKWKMGDGTTYRDKESVDHKYDEPGTYDVTFEIEDIGGKDDKITKTIYVSEPVIPIPPTPEYPTLPFNISEMYKLVKADKLPETLNEIKVMVIDSGIQPVVYDGVDLTKVEMQYHPSMKNGFDTYGHGTWCNYAIAYILQQKVPNAKQISYKVFDERGTSTQNLLDALDAAIEQDVDVVSLSAGSLGGNPQDPLSRKCEQMANQGIVIIVAAGNYGPRESTIMSPGVSDSVIAVGAFDPILVKENRMAGILDLSDDKITSWSSRGPVMGVGPKPDCTAPGESIIGPWKRKTKIASGTSMATPIVAGATAVILANNKEIIDRVEKSWWNKGDIPRAYEEALEKACYEKGDANIWGAGIVQFDELSDIFSSNLRQFILLEYYLPYFLPIVLIIIALAVYIAKRKKILA